MSHFDGGYKTFLSCKEKPELLRLKVHILVNTKHNATHPTVKLSLKHPIWIPGQAGYGPTQVYERTLSYNYKIQNTLFVIIKSVVEQNIGAQKRSIFKRPVVIMEVDTKM